MIECFDPDPLKFLEFFERWFRIDHIPIVRQARIIDLQHDSSLDDRLVFLAHRFGGGKDELLLGLVIEIFASRETAGPYRAHEAFLDAGYGYRHLQIRDVGGQRRMPDILDRRGADRASGWAPRGAADQAAGRIGVLIELAELPPIAGSIFQAGSAFEGVPFSLGLI